MIKPQLYNATEEYGPNAFCNTETINWTDTAFVLSLSTTNTTAISARGNTVQHNTIKVIQSDCGIVVICSTRKWDKYKRQDPDKI